MMIPVDRSITVRRYMAAFRSAASRSAYGNSKRMDSPGSLPCFGFAKPGAAQLGVRESLETPHLHRAGIRTALAPDTVHLAAPQVVLVVLAGRNRPGCHAGAGSGEWTGPGPCTAGRASCRHAFSRLGVRVLSVGFVAVKDCLHLVDFLLLGLHDRVAELLDFRIGDV